ncbi:Glucose/arabinose dehydrogenase, beta-propeller fold [Chitinophaga sp. YR573]|uniref:c-type cytochrome n=1 Tax=Chitinophaga sp. YR573 TaxID=1881040 RepID=UPI0008BF7B6B|nr:c-type cytochrome [Chitinophaga sp. YR573]SEW06550.1 Glucose/arabinose dehydrogenase, beta-propeller fold [Chitinophaga sp. YR573]
MCRLFLFCLMVTAVSCTHQKVLPLPAADPDNGGLILPGNFEAVVVAEGVGRARHLTVNDNGDIYVKLTYNDIMDGRGGTVALRDNDNDGKADVIAYFGDYKDEGGQPAGIAIHDGYLYTSTVKYVLRNKLKAGQLVPDSKTEIILTDEDKDLFRHWHSAKPLCFDNDGHMYVPFGAPTDAAQDIKSAGPAGMPGGKGLDPAPDLEWHAGIWQFSADKAGQTQKDGVKYATGIRSALGLAWSPLDNTLYSVVNGMDNFHTRYPGVFTAWQAAVLPAETFVKVKEHADFGWPYAYYDQMQGKNVLQPGYGGDGKIVGRASKFDTPLIGFPGHWAPMDLLFYQGNQFPERYKKGAFIAFHGSTDRSPYPQAGYIVCFVPFENGAPTGKWEVFADGFTGVDTVMNTSDAVYRPMGLATGPDGSLYISESNKGKIWRVMYKGTGKFGEAQLSKMEERKSRSYIKTPDEVKDNMGKGGEMAGMILFNSYCSSCHQRNGMGDNNRYPPLANSEFVTGDKDRLIKIILNGLQGEITVDNKKFNGQMPAHGSFLDDHAVASIVTFIKRRFTEDEKFILTEEEVKKLR